MMRAFEVGAMHAAIIVYAETKGKARYRGLLRLGDAWRDLTFKDLTCREISLERALQSSPEFLDCARMRGLPFARVGMKVTVDGNAGVIVGHNDSSNFDVYFESGPHRGTVGNCHPGWRFEFEVKHE